MSVFLETVAANAILAIFLAIVVFGITRFLKKPSVVYWLWMLVLLKLITPPLVDLPLAIAPSWAQIENPTSPSPAIEKPVFVTQAPTSTAPQEIPLPEETGATPENHVKNPALSIPDDLSLLAFTSEENEQQRSLHDFSSVELTDSTSVSPRADLSTVLPRKLPAHRPWDIILGTTWLAGTISWFALAVLRILRFERLINRAQPAPARLKQQARNLADTFGLKACPKVLIVEDRVPPLLWSARRPAVIVLPRALLEEMKPKDQEMLLAHELAHFRRRDHWFRWFEVVILGLYWWHPVVWLARRQLQQAEEQCCDAWVLWAFPQQAKSYAHVLLSTIDFLSVSRSPLPAVASGMGQVHYVKRRFEMILKDNVSRRSSWPVRIGLCLFSILVLGLSARIIQAEPQTPESGPVAKAELVANETTLPEARSIQAALQEFGSTLSTLPSSPKYSTTLDTIRELIKSLDEDKQYKERAQKQKAVIDELNKLEIYVWQYEPNRLGKINRRLPASIRDGFRKELGQNVFSSPSAISINKGLSKKEFQKVLEHLKTFSQLQKASCHALNDEQVEKLKTVLPKVKIENNTYTGVRNIDLLVAPNAAPAYGQPQAATPIGLPGPPHIPLGLPASPPTKRRKPVQQNRLSATAKEKAIKALIEMLKDQDQNVRIAAASSLARTHLSKSAKDRAIKALIEILKDKDQNVRIAAASSLVRIGRGSSEAVSVFEVSLTEDDDPNIRLSAARALGEIRQPSDKTIHALVNALTDQDKKVRESVHYSLKTMAARSKSVVDGLLRAVMDENETLNKNASSVLRSIEPASDEVILRLIEALKIENVRVRNAATYALGRIKTDKTGSNYSWPIPFTIHNGPTRLPRN